MAYEPSESDIRWLTNPVKSLNLGGAWVAPMGFAFKKTAEKRLELYSITATSLQAAAHIKANLEGTVEVGKAAGIEVVIEGCAEYALLILNWGERP
jgi:hypothetical protein